MRRLAVAATIAALTLLGGQASAATYLKYQFQTLDSFDGQFEGSFTGFIETPPGPVGETIISGAALPACVTTMSAVTVDCSMAKLISGFDFFGDGSLTLDVVELWFVNASNQYSYYFDPGAFATVGLHTTAMPALFAGQTATLRVSRATSLAVPEPGTWAMMILGFAGAGAALRAERRRRALA